MSKIRLHGSSSGYTEIAPVAASGNNTLTLPNDGTIISKDAAGAVGVTSIVTTTATITTAKVGAAVTITESGIEASGIGITCANINGTQIGGRRNIIINGAMMVAQRGTSTTTTGYLIDRQNVYFDGLDESLTMEQADISSGTDPYNEGFRKSLKLTNGNQTSGADVGDRIQPQNKIEAQDIASSGWKYTDPNSFITLSFWAKSSVTQTFYGYFRSKNGTEQRYAYSVALSANTWTKVIKTIPGNSNLQFDNNANEGLQWNILLPFIGTNLTDSSVSLNSWGTYSGSARTPDNTSTWYTTNDATFELTGLQLEVGSQATAFEHRSFAEELPLCQRYYYRWASGSQKYLASGGYYSTGLFACVFSFPTTMRATPTLDYQTGADYFLIYSGGGNDGVNAANYVRGHTNGGGFDITDGASGTLGYSGFLSTNNSSTQISFNAEL